MDPTSSNETFDPKRRRLCRDGACVGLVGDDGRCRECGRTEAEAALGAERPDALDADVDADADVDLGAGSRDANGEASPAAGGFDPGRRLCDDGSCVGVVGPDGTCSVCGRRAE
jgi:hypothetical protein